MIMARMMKTECNDDGGDGDSDYDDACYDDEAIMKMPVMVWVMMMM